MGEWLFVSIHTKTNAMYQPAHETCTKEDVQSQTFTSVINQLHIIFLLRCYSIQSPDFTRLFSF